MLRKLRINSNHYSLQPIRSFLVLAGFELLCFNEQYIVEKLTESERVREKEKERETGEGESERRRIVWRFGLKITSLVFDYESRRPSKRLEYRKTTYIPLRSMSKKCWPVNFSERPTFCCLFLSLSFFLSIPLSYEKRRRMAHL